jgi:hypothetical protein
MTLVTVPRLDALGHGRLPSGFPPPVGTIIGIRGWHVNKTAVRNREQRCGQGKAMPSWNTLRMGPCVIGITVVYE